MATTTKTMAATNGSRDHELRMMLEGRRRELVFEVQGKIRDGRRDFTNEREVLDEGDSSVVDIQEEIEFALDPDESRNAEQDRRGAPPDRRRDLR